jgi:hypothetical protein
MRIAAVVEGYGDVSAVPTLLAKLGTVVDIELHAPNPIRAGEWPKLKRPGELERFLELAASRNLDRVVLILDMDDSCPVSEAQNFWDRVTAWKGNRNVDVGLCFIMKEYESFFLSCIDDLATAGHPRLQQCIQNAESTRSAKQLLKEIVDGRYKETQHQLEYTKKIEIRNLFVRSRSFRCLAKAATGLTYEQLNSLISAG